MRFAWVGQYCEVGILIAFANVRKWDLCTGFESP
jgi:hypothetical protein